MLSRGKLSFESVRVVCLKIVRDKSSDSSTSIKRSVNNFIGDTEYLDT